jgi:MFS family permease
MRDAHAATVAIDEPTHECRPLWRDRRFATYWIGQGVSQFGDRITELALPLIAVTTLQADASTVGLLTAAVWAPNLVSLFIGTWVDHQARKRRLLIAADVIRCLTIASLPLAHYAGVVTLSQLFAVALIAGFGQVLYQTSYQTFFVGLVRKEQYVEANSLLSATRSISFVAGPAVAGGLIEAFTAPVAVLVDAISFAVSALMIWRVRVVEPPVDTAGEPRLWRRARDGMALVVRHPYLRASLACVTTLNLFNFVASALLILFASRHLHLSAGVIGLAFGVGAVGGLVGTYAAGRLARLIGVGRTIALGAVVFSAPIALVPLAGGPELVRAGVLAFVEFWMGVGVMCLDIPLNALQTAVTPDGVRSRVVGAFATVNYGIRPVGAILGGILGSTVGIAPTMVVAAVGGSLAFVWLLPSPIISTRTIDELEPVG